MRTLNKDAADVLGCSEGTIAWRIHEARRRLRLVLGSEDEAQIEAVVGRRAS